MDDDFVEVHFHVGERVADFQALVNLFFHLTQNSLRNEPEGGANHHAQETPLEPSGAFDEEEETATEDGAEKEKQAFEDCVFHDGETLRNSTSTVKAFFC